VIPFVDLFVVESHCKLALISLLYCTNCKRVAFVKTSNWKNGKVYQLYEVKLFERKESYKMTIKFWSLK
jgi:hypothetical protein